MCCVYRYILPTPSHSLALFSFYVSWRCNANDGKNLTWQNGMVTSLLCDLRPESFGRSTNHHDLRIKNRMALQLPRACTMPDRRKNKSSVVCLMVFINHKLGTWPSGFTIKISIPVKPRSDLKTRHLVSPERKESLATEAPQPDPAQSNLQKKWREKI